MISKSLIQFSVDGWGCVPSLLFDLRPNYGGSNEDNGYLFKKFPRTQLSAPTLQEATADPCLHRRLLDTHWQVWVSLLWGHCSFLLGPGMHKVLFVPFIFLGSKITADGNCSHEIKRLLLLGSKAMTKLSSVQFSCSVVSDSLRPHESQHSRPR